MPSSTLLSVNLRDRSMVWQKSGWKTFDPAVQPYGRTKCAKRSQQCGRALNLAARFPRAGYVRRGFAFRQCRSVTMVSNRLRREARWRRIVDFRLIDARLSLQFDQDLPAPMIGRSGAQFGDIGPAENALDVLARVTLFQIVKNVPAPLAPMRHPAACIDADIVDAAIRRIDAVKLQYQRVTVFVRHRCLS